MSQTTNMELYLGRQPILDSRALLIGYELLFRSDSVNAVNVYDDTQATSRVIINMLNGIGPARILGKKQGFINFNRKMFTDKAYDLLNPKQFVLEILENVSVDEETLEAIQDAISKGFKIALDDFDFSDEMTEKFGSLFDIISYLKVDVMLTPLALIKEKLPELKKYNFELIAEKVEKESQFIELRDLGFDYFQGFFFAKPEIIKERSLDPSLQAVMEVLTLLQKDVEIDELEIAFKKNPEITINLLRFINSASMGTRSEISSVRQALTLTGKQKLKQWLMMMMYAQPGVSTSDSSLLSSASQRAKIIELLLIKKGVTDSDIGFLTGIMSQLDAVYKTPLKYLLRELHVPSSIKNAILEHEGVLGELLELTIALEKVDNARIAELLEKLGLTKADFRVSILESYAWVESCF